jgi:type II secretory pathway component PulM
MAKITQLHVYIIGGVLMLIIGGGLWFTLIKPLNEANESLRGEISGIETAQAQVDGQGFTISQASAAAEKLETAKQRRNNNEARLKALEAKYQVAPPKRIVIGNTEDEILRTTMARWFNLPREVVTLMEGYAQKLAKKHAVTVATNFAAPASPADPKKIPTDIIAYQLGGMSVRGPFPNVMRWVQDWNSAPLLVSVDGLKCGLAGDKGVVTATCALTAYVFPTGPGATIPGAGAPAGGGMAMPGADPGAMYSDMPGGGANGPGGGGNM